MTNIDNLKLETAKITLRKLSLEHLDDYLALLNDPEVHKTTEPHKFFVDYKRDKIIDWLNEIQLKKDRLDFAIIDNTTDRLIGEVVLNEIIGQTSNIRIALKSTEFGKGFGFDAMKLTIDHAFKVLHLTQITLTVFTINKRGFNLYKKLGFTETSKSIYEGYEESLMVIKNSI